MLFTDDERNQIETQVAMTLLADKSALAALIGPYHAVRIESSSVPVLYARNAIRYVESSAWVEQPALVVQLVKQYAVMANFQAILDRLSTLSPPRFHTGASAWETCLLALQLPFLGRESTRLAVRDFFPPDVGTPATARVLVVTGGGRTGKSFTLDYSRYVASFPGGWAVAGVDFRTQVVAQLGPAELVRQLAEQIAPNQPLTLAPPTLEQRARWVINLTETLVSLAAASGKSWIIVLDGFRGSDVPADTHEFIQQLAAGLAGAPLPWSVDPREPPPLRLLLLDYTEPLQVENGFVRHDEAALVGPAEVMDYFRRFAAWKGWPTFEPRALEQIASFTLQKVTASGPATNERIAAAVLEVADEMERTYGTKAVP